MSTPHLEERWIEDGGELAEEPRTGMSLNDDIIVGVGEVRARVPAR